MTFYKLFMRPHFDNSDGIQDHPIRDNSLRDYISTTQCPVQYEKHKIKRTKSEVFKTKILVLATYSFLQNQT